MKWNVVALHVVWVAAMATVSWQIGVASGFHGVFRGVAVAFDVMGAYVPIIGMAAILAIASRGSVAGAEAAVDLRRYGAVYLVPLLAGGVIAIAICIGGFLARNHVLLPLLVKGGYSRVIPGLTFAAAFFLIATRRKFRAAMLTGVASIIFMAVALMKR